MFYEKADAYNSKLLEFCPFSINGSTPDFSKMETGYKDALIELANKYLDFKYPAIPATLFMSFTRTGNRTNFEDAYFDRRRALNSLVMAECVVNDNRYIDDIINGIYSICEESAWQLPAHNSYTRDAPQLLLPDTTLPVLDLFSCETAALLSIVRYLLKDKLDKVSPLIVKRIETELISRIIEPYLNCHFWWMGNGDEPMCNWTIWCTQNILITAFTLNLSYDIKQKIFLKACKSVDYFLAEYGDDGCCDEGAQYYRHAGLCLFNTLEVLNAVTNNYFLDMYSDNKIKNIALYILNVHVNDKYYINFADCSPIAGRAGIREFLFGKRINHIDLMTFAAFDYKLCNTNSKLLPNEINLFYRLQCAFTHSEIMKFNTNNKIFHNDIFYKSVGIFKAQDKKMCLAVKAGDNADSHNHNDTGSFTIYKNGKPMFIDVGVESYTKKTFSPNRYEIWTMQSSYHNLPEIDNTMQMDGEQYKATDILVEFTEDLASISMDISKAYPLNKLEYYRRSITFNKNKEITIADSFNGCEKVTINLLTYNKPKYENNILYIGAIGKALIDNVKSLEIEAIPITDKRLKTAWKHEVYRIKITPSKDNITFKIPV